ncbi:MAG: 30S ribosomal protein S2 [Candidatus Levybacteria bacterium RBG_16_35_6]|nr:MAG: 30S ribosomal protein S2 [Candidatus Levybacteria bacterium RBG_16_35_6]
MDHTGSLFYIAERWVGGILTNFSEISKNLKKLKDLTEKISNEKLQEGYTKKEIGLWDKERQRLELLYGGIASMEKTPGALFIIDSHLEDLAVREASKMGVITSAIVDTNADPQLIDYPIPANDDAVGSIKLITSYIMDAWVEGKKESFKKNKKEEVKKEIKPKEVKKEKQTKKEEDGKSKPSGSKKTKK